MQSFYIKNSFNFCGIKISNTSKSIIIAEISANHNGSLRRAKNLIKEAKRSGADLIKIQTYTGNSLAIDCKKKDFKISKKSPWHKHGNLWNLYENAKTPYSWHKELFKYSHKIGIPIFSSPFDEESVDFLDSINVPFFKMASADLTNFPLLEHTAKKQRPMVISTGMADFNTVQEAYNLVSRINPYISILQCTSSYPTLPDHINLNVIRLYQK